MRAAYDEIAEWYETEFLAVQRLGAEDREYADVIGVDRALVELLGRGSGVCLEVGCGTGIYAERVASLGWTPAGVDLSAGMLGYACERLPVAHGDAVCLPFADGSVPAIISLMTHTDMPDYEAALREMSRVLQPGGKLVHVGVHPCFCGDFADRTKPPEVVVGPGYLERTWVEGVGLGEGEVGQNGQVRDKVGAGHVPLAGLLNSFAAAGLRMDRFVEGYGPTPITLSVLALAEV